MSKKSAGPVSTTPPIGEAIEKIKGSAEAPLRTNKASSTDHDCRGVPLEATGLGGLLTQSPPSNQQLKLPSSPANLAGFSRLPRLAGALAASELNARNLARLAALNRFAGVKGIEVGLPPNRLSSVTKHMEIATPTGKVVQAKQHTAIATAKDIGKLVRSAREVLGLSQQSFADLAGVGRRFVSELENGKASLEFDKVLKVATAAGIDLLAKSR